MLNRKEGGVVGARKATDALAEMGSLGQITSQILTPGEARVILGSGLASLLENSQRSRVFFRPLKDNVIAVFLPELSAKIENLEPLRTNPLTVFEDVRQAVHQLNRTGGVVHLSYLPGEQFVKEDVEELSSVAKMMWGLMTEAQQRKLTAEGVGIEFLNIPYDNYDPDDF